MKKIITFALILLIFGTMNSVSAESDIESYVDFEDSLKIKFVQKELDPEKVDEYLLKYDAVFIYHTKNKDSDNLPVAEFIINQDGMTLYKDYYTIQENSIKLKKELKQFAKDAEELIIEFPEFFYNEEKLSPNTLLQVEKISPTFLINVQTDVIEPQEMALVTGEWIQNSTVHMSEKTFKPYGKINYTMKYYEQVSQDHYFTRVENHVEFIPGIALRNAGDNTYDTYKFDDIARHKVYLTTYVVNPYVTGDEPKGIDYWPINGTGIYTVSSAWGLSGTVGYSEENGFNGSLVGSFSRATTYTVNDPDLDAMQITVGKTFNWTYDGFESKDDNTLHHYPGIMVEQKTDTSFEGTFGTRQDFYMLVDRWYSAEQDLNWTVYSTKIGQ